MQSHCHKKCKVCRSTKACQVIWATFSTTGHKTTQVWTTVRARLYINLTVLSSAAKGWLYATATSFGLSVRSLVCLSVVWNAYWWWRGLIASAIRAWLTCSINTWISYSYDSASVTDSVRRRDVFADELRHAAKCNKQWNWIVIIGSCSCTI